MTQPTYGYEPQYSFWPYYQATPQQLLTPARTAGWLLMALGALLLLGASCVGAVLFGLPDAEFQNLIAEASRQQPEIRQLNPTPQMVRILYGSMMGVVGIYGLILIPLALFVRRGTLFPVILALLLTGLPLLLMAVMFLTSLFSGLQGVLGFICLGGIPSLLMIFALIFLIRAAGNSSKIAQSQQQMQAMYHQQMQQYYSTQQTPAPPPGDARDA
jgi:hypothetical protein